MHRPSHSRAWHPSLVFLRRDYYSLPRPTPSHSRSVLDHRQKHHHFRASLDPVLELRTHVDEGSLHRLLLLSAEIQKRLAFQKRKRGREWRRVRRQLLSGSESEQDHFCPVVILQRLAQDAVLGGLRLFAGVANIYIGVVHA